MLEEEEEPKAEQGRDEGKEPIDVGALYVHACSLFAIRRNFNALLCHLAKI